MFDFIGLLPYLNNHQERVVANTKISNIEIDTCFADDIGKDFETGLCINGVWLIVEDYDTKEEAKAGHEKYVKLIQNKELKNVVDIYGAGSAEIIY